MSATLTTEAATYVTIESLVQRLQAQGIKVPCPGEVRDYLTRYPGVIEVTEKASDLTQSEFAGRAELSLELYRDPEIDDPHLVLYVQQDTFDQTTKDKIERIRDGYEMELADLSGWLHVTTDHRAPDAPFSRLTPRP